MQTQDRTIDLTPYGGIKFVESTHKYTNADGVRYSGITSLLHNYYEPFDTELGSLNKAIKEVVIDTFGDYKFGQLKRDVYNKEVQKIQGSDDLSREEKDALIKRCIGHNFLYTKLYAIKKKHPATYNDIMVMQETLKKEWAEKSRISSVEGTAEHDKREREIKEKGYDFEGKHFDYDPDLNILNVPTDKRIVIPECLVWDHKLKLGGLADVFLFDKGKIIVQDYKTNESIDKTAFMDKKMLGVCSSLPDTNFYHYSLQMRIYQEMALNLRPEFKKGKNAIIHTLNPRYGREEDTILECCNVDKVVANMFEELLMDAE